MGGFKIPIGEPYNTEGYPKEGISLKKSLIPILAIIGNGSLIELGQLEYNC